MRNRVLLVVLFALLSGGAAAAAEPPPTVYPRLCAELDLAVISDIELAANTHQIAGEKLAAAFFSLLRARSACAEGRDKEAIAIYDSILFD